MKPIVFRIIVSLVFILFAASLFLPKANAIDIRNGTAVGVGQDEVVNQSVTVAGQTVDVDGTVKGDVYCAGKQVTISGTVEGDVLCAGQNVHISGTVLGNVRVAAQQMDITGTVKKNVSVLSQTLTVGKEAFIAGELLVMGQTLTVDGKVDKRIDGSLLTTQINGRVLGDIKVDTDTLTFGSGAVVKGQVIYTSTNSVVVPKTASVSGVITRVEPDKASSAKHASAAPASKETPWPLNALSSILVYLIIGFVVVAVFPAFTQRVIGVMKDGPTGVGLIGFITLIGVPMAAIMLAVTIVGIPIALLLILIYITALVVCQIFVAYIVGAYVLDSFKIGQKGNVLLPMLVGVPIFWFIVKMPFLGGIVSFIAVIWSLGGMIKSLKSAKK